MTTDGVRWSDGHEERADTVILGTGYRPALDFLPTEAFEADGWPAHRRGISSTVRGLGYVGLPGQTGVASAMLRRVGPDAAHFARQLQRQLKTGDMRHQDPASVAGSGG